MQLFIVITWTVSLAIAFILLWVFDIQVIKDELLHLLADIQPQKPKVTLYSTVTGNVVSRFVRI